MRVAHIDADAGKGLKTFDSLVLAKTSEAQADKIKELSHAYYGVAGMASSGRGSGRASGCG